MPSQLAKNPIIKKDGVVVFSDNTPVSPLTHTLKYSNGELKITGLKRNNRKVEVFTDRDDPYAYREGAIEEVEFEFTCDVVGWADATESAAFDVVYKLGTWSSAVSMLAAQYGDVWMWKAVWTIERTNYGATADNTLTLKYCTGSADLAEGTPTRLTIKGTARIPQHDASNAIAFA